MKTRLLLAVVGLAIGFALPTFAQQTNKPDPQLRQKLVDAIKKHTDALDKNDATAVATNFTENGILVTLNGPIFGREAIEKHYAEDFKQGFRSSKNTATPMLNAEDVRIDNLPIGVDLNLPGHDRINLSRVKLLLVVSIEKR